MIIHKNCFTFDTNIFRLSVQTNLLVYDVMVELYPISNLDP